MAWMGDESSTRPGARRLSLSLLVELGDEVREVGPTMRRERSGVD